MSPRERLAWSCLVGTLVCMVPYWLSVVWLWQTNQWNVESLTASFVAMVIAQVIFQASLAIIQVVRSREPIAPKDEREFSFETRAAKHAYWVLTSGAWVGIGLLAMPRVSQGDPVLTIDSLLAIHYLLAGFTLAEMVYYGSLVCSYRRGY